MTPAATLLVGNVYVYFCRWINPPHDKIALCICASPPLFFWFNSKAAFHGQDQLRVAAREHAAITRDCYLDLSGVKGISDLELRDRKDRGTISDVFRARILAALTQPIKLLPEVHRKLALASLTR
jgi:hypothetical protein